MAHVAAPDARATVSPPAQDSDGPEPFTAETENVTVPVAVPTERGRPTTTAVTAAGWPERTKAVVRMKVLELALDTGCVTDADEAATPELPGYDTDTVYGPSAAVSTPAPTLQWVVLLPRPMTLLPERHGMVTPERLLIPQETDPDGPVFPDCAEPTTAEK
jgi:hypothetical protein